MKKYLNYVGMLFSMLALTMFIACSDDDGNKPEIPDDVTDGFYVLGADDEPLGTNRMTTGFVAEGETRANFYEAYIYLSGDFNIVQYISNEPVVWGGTYELIPMGTNGDISIGQGVAEQGGAPIAPIATGLHHVHLDFETGKFYVSQVEYFEIIGSATADGWSSGQRMDAISATADEVIFQATGVVLREGQYKFRYNSNWDTETGDGFNIHSNFGIGGEAAGTNIDFAEQDGEYTVTVTYTPGPGPSLSANIERTGDVQEISFDPDNYQWGIIGAATQPDGWGSDKKLTYLTDQSGTTFTWRGVFPLRGGTADNTFKFRTDDSWSVKLIPNDVTPTNLTADGTISDDADTNGDGQWFVNDGFSGLYYFQIETPDAGETWTLTIDEAAPSVVGEGVLGWPSGDDDLDKDVFLDVIELNADNTTASASAEVTFGTGEWKFRFSQNWNFPLGGDDLANPLVFNGGNFSAAGETATVTLTTTDGGVTWSASVE